jgi:hypothetical protein
MIRLEKPKKGKTMPSLDGYSLGEQIKKLRKEVFEELSISREAFSELYQYILKFDEKIKVIEQKPEKVKKKKAKATA